MMPFTRRGNVQRWRMHRGACIVMRARRKSKGGIWIEKGRGTVHHAACITKHDGWDGSLSHCLLARRCRPADMSIEG